MILNKRKTRNTQKFMMKIFGAQKIGSFLSFHNLIFQRKMDKKGFEFSFAWLFAIIVGAFVIFLAIYATTSLIGSSRYEGDTRTAAQLKTILSPIETNLEDSKFVGIGFPDETRIFNNCNEFGNFGSQKISTSTRSNVGKEWQMPGAIIESFNKYIFSSNIVQGRKVHVFAKPLKMPYKIADMMFMYSGEYCFINPPDNIREEVEDLNLPGINITIDGKYCLEDSKKICFFSSNKGCDVFVGENDVDGVYYQESLVYGAIFSDKEIYECQLKRLMKRNSELAQLYAAKTSFLSSKGCSSNLAGDLISYSDILKEFEDSSELNSIKFMSDEIGDENERLKCKLF